LAVKSEKKGKRKIKEYNVDNMKYTVKVEYIILRLIFSTRIRIEKALVLKWEL